MVQLQWQVRIKTLWTSKVKCCSNLINREQRSRKMICKTTKDSWWPRMSIRCNQSTPMFINWNSTKLLVNSNNQSSLMQMYNKWMLQFNLDYPMLNPSNSKLSRWLILNSLLNSKANKAFRNKAVTSWQLKRSNNRNNNCNSHNSHSSSSSINRDRSKWMANKMPWVKTKCNCLHNQKLKEKMIKSKQETQTSNRPMRRLLVLYHLNCLCRNFRSLNNKGSLNQKWMLLKWTKLKKTGRWCQAQTWLRALLTKTRMKTKMVMQQIMQELWQRMV